MSNIPQATATIIVAFLDYADKNEIAMAPKDVHNMAKGLREIFTQGKLDS